MKSSSSNYWARSSPLGPSLPVNQVIEDHGCFTTKRAQHLRPYSTASLYETSIPSTRPHNTPTTHTHTHTHTTRNKWDLRFVPPSCKLKNKIGKKQRKTRLRTWIGSISLDFFNKKHPDKTHIYTDGSKYPDKDTAGAAFIVPAQDIYFPIKTNPHLSVFTTELIAIEYAIVWIIQNKLQKAVILTDSLSAE